MYSNEHDERGDVTVIGTSNKMSSHLSTIDPSHVCNIGYMQHIVFYMQHTGLRKKRKKTYERRQSMYSVKFSLLITLPFF